MIIHQWLALYKNKPHVDEKYLSSDHNVGALGKSIENTHPRWGTSRTESIPLFSDTARREIVSPIPNPDLSVPI